MLKPAFVFALLAGLLVSPSAGAQDSAGSRKTIPIEAGEKWFGAAVTASSKMPFTEGYSLDLRQNAAGNQAAPLLLSTTGRYIWSAKPFAFQFGAGTIDITGAADSVLVAKPGKTLSDAFLAASRRFFPSSGKMPDSLLFLRPQYNTWIELVYNQNQQDVLKYAHDIVDHGFPPGVLMIDDNWATDYGKFEFRRDRFPDPKKMISELHQLGFKVMVWVCPFISPDGEVYRALLEKKYLLMDGKSKGDAAVVKWWNGSSAVMDFSNPAAVSWYKAQLTRLSDSTGVDGYKFDAGDPEFYPDGTSAFRNTNGNDQTELWGSFGLDYPLNEYRAMWKQGGQPLAERLRDKSHSWEDLQTLIPDITTSGLLGYAFACPDMIGGGEFGSFIGKDKLDQDLIVRSAECSALMPMMQFSVAPWRVLDSPHLKAVEQMVKLRQRFVPYIMQLTRQAATSGIPIVRKMEYVFPNQGFATCRDQFMLGDSVLVAPVLVKGEKRVVAFPKGKWTDAGGTVFRGPVSREMTAPIGELLWFTRKSK